ncbi:MAG: DUF4358 domain-containing protein [Oscillospiraceae bacterium]
MKKLFSILSSALLLSVLLASCGTGSASYNLGDVLTAVDAAVKIDNPKDISQDDVIYDLGVTFENVEEFAGKTSNTNGEAGYIIVIKAKQGKADTVKAELETARDGKAEALASYPEFATAAAITKSGRVVVKGDYVLLAIGADKSIAEKDGAEKAYANVDTAIADAFK